MQKLAIVGSHPDTRDNAPFGNPEYDIWVFNEAAQADWCKRWDVCFQIHKPEIYRSPHNRSNDQHWTWLQQEHGERIIYMQDYDPQVPNSYPYPLEAVKRFTETENFFTSSFAYAMALVILRGDYDVIDIYGMDLTSNTEYTYQAAGFYYWVGMARGSAIEINVKCWPGVFDAPLYGYDGEVSLGNKHYADRMAQLDKNWKAADKELARTKAVVDRLLKLKDHAKLIEATQTYKMAAIECGKASGALSEAKRYFEYGERPVYRQEYEFSMARSQRDAEQHRVKMWHMGGMIEYVWNAARAGQDQAYKQLSNMIVTMGRSAYDLGAHSGIYDENYSYMQTFDALAQAAGGRKSLEIAQLAVTV